MPDTISVVGGELFTLRRAVPDTPLLIAALALLAGCAEVLDIPDDPEVVEPIGPWSCSTSALAPTPVAETARVRLKACGAFGDCSTTVTGLSAKICRKLDVGCTQPIVDAVSDVGGVLEFNVPTGERGFDGYVALSSPGEPCDVASASSGFAAAVCGLLPGCNGDGADPSCLLPAYAPVMLFMNPPVTSDMALPIELPMVPTLSLPALVGATGTDFDPLSGNLLVTTLDCAAAPAAGVRYTLSGSSGSETVLYVENGVLSNASSLTDRTGMGAFVGLRPGFVNVIAHDGAGARIGAIGVRVAPFTITQSLLLPSP
jgi:hypothetical protein